MINHIIAQKTEDESLQLLTVEELQEARENTDTFALGSSQYHTIAATANALLKKYPNPDEILKIVFSQEPELAELLKFEKDTEILGERKELFKEEIEQEEEWNKEENDTNWAFRDLFANKNHLPISEVTIDIYDAMAGSSYDLWSALYFVPINIVCTFFGVTQNMDLKDWPRTLNSDGFRVYLLLSFDLIDDMSDIDSFDT